MTMQSSKLSAPTRARSRWPPSRLSGPDASARSSSSTLPADVLIIVPVRNLVLFPGTVVPVAIGRAALDRRGAGSRARRAAGRHRAAARPERRRPGAERPAPGRHHRQRPALRHRARTAPITSICQGEQRFRVLEFVARLSVPGRARRADRRAGGRRHRGRGARSCCLKRAGARGDRSCCRRRRRAGQRHAGVESPSHARRPGRELHRHQARPRSRRSSRRSISRARLDRVLELLDAPHRGAAALARDRRADPGSARRAPARVRAARAADDDPEGARRGRGHGGRDRGAGEGDRQGRHARGGREAGAQGAASASSACPRPRPSTRWCAPTSTG